MYRCLAFISIILVFFWSGCSSHKTHQTTSFELNEPTPPQWYLLSQDHPACAGKSTQNIQNFNIDLARQRAKQDTLKCFEDIVVSWMNSAYFLKENGYAELSGPRETTELAGDTFLTPPYYRDFSMKLESAIKELDTAKETTINFGGKYTRYYVLVNAGETEISQIIANIAKHYIEELSDESAYRKNYKKEIIDCDIAVKFWEKVLQDHSAKDQ